MQLSTVFLAAGLCSTTAPAFAEVSQKTETGFVVRIAGEVAVSPAEAWTAFISPAKWWNNTHTFSGEAANLTMDATANGCFCEKMPVPKDAAVGQRAGSVMHMRIIYAEPFRALRMSGGLGPLQSEAVVGTMTVTFKPVDGAGGKATRILWEYVVGGFMRYNADTISGAVDKVMTEQLAGFINLVGPQIASAPGVASEQIAPEESPVQESPTIEPDSALTEAAAGESVKATLDKLFKKGDDNPPR